MTSTAINWPAILKYRGENELTYVASQADWNTDADLHVIAYEEDDRLIDSHGLAYSLCQRDNHHVTPQQTEQTMSLADVIELVKAHLSELGSCCISKMFAPSISAAIEMASPSDDK